MSHTVVKERGIIMQAHNVLAILEGRKTQTRRIVKPQPAQNTTHFGFIVSSTCRKEIGCWRGRDVSQPAKATSASIRCPYGKPGDRLWVREALLLGEEDFTYKADGTEVEVPKGTAWGHRIGTVSPIHMPRWASRILLEIVDVRVERVQAISEADAIAEGVAIDKGSAFHTPDGHHAHRTAVGCFNTTWNHINGACNFESNPWVWALTFKRIGGGA